MTRPLLLAALLALAGCNWFRSTSGYWEPPEGVPPGQVKAEIENCRLATAPTQWRSLVYSFEQCMRDRGYRFVPFSQDRK